MTTLNHHNGPRPVSAQTWPPSAPRVRDDHRPQQELIINAAGTNMCPFNVENAVPAASLLGALPWRPAPRAAR